MIMSVYRRHTWRGGRKAIASRLAAAAAADGFVRRYDIHPTGTLYPRRTCDMI